jgi:peptidoglycan/LPS O-acetylase OafA/YrhL
MAVIGPILKNAWGLATASVIIGFIHRHGWVLHDLMSYSGYKIIGRISYATMICHFFIIKLLMTSSYHPTILSDANLVS